MDAAFAWLESLAAKHGADADSLLVAPEERQETAPDWIQQQSALRRSQNRLNRPRIAPPPPQPAVTLRIGSWMRRKPRFRPNRPRPRKAALPDWLKQLESSPDATLEPILPEEEEAFFAVEISRASRVLPETEKAGVDWFQEFNEPSAEKPAGAAPEAEKPAEELPPSPRTGPLRGHPQIGQNPPTAQLVSRRPAPPSRPAEAAKPQEPPLPSLDAGRTRTPAGSNSPRCLCR